MSKLKKQIMTLALVAASFILFNLGIYFCFTVRYIDTSAELMQSKSIELDKYLPFDENSLITDFDTEIQLYGDLPVLDGATALFPVYSAFMNSVYPEGSCTFDGADFAPESLLQKRGTGGAYKAIVSGDADIIFVAQPSEQQIDFAEENDVELEYVPIGYEGFVFIVNKENPVDNLTAEQLKGIYSGNYTNWKYVGGENVPINALQRVENSGSQTAMIAFMGDTPLMESTTNLFGRSIGYSFRFYVTDLAGKANIKLLSVNGIYPDKENIRSGAYPITDSFYAVYRKDNDNPNVAKLIEWITSLEGQQIVEDSGYVSAY